MFSETEIFIYYASAQDYLQAYFRISFLVCRTNWQMREDECREIRIPDVFS